MSAVSRVGPAFESEYGGPAAAVWSAPGRVNLVGEHTDYNDGFVLPFALSHRTAVAAAAAAAPEWTVWSEASGERLRFGPSDLAPGAVKGWAGYLAAVVWVLREAGVDVPYLNLAICSDVAVGAGLSSSAALECATLAVLVELAGSDLPRHRWPALAQRAENHYVGVPCGIMDQSASTLCQPGHALFLDCRSLESEQVPFDLAAAGLTMLIADTNAPHRHSDNEYAARRATCEQAAATLGVPALRDVSLAVPESLDAVSLDSMSLDAMSLDAVSLRRVRHVVTENQRVLEVVALLRAGRTDEIGPLLTASHASLRDDYDVTVPQLDVAVEAALDAGALGARMTGGGFGGCVIALVRTAQSDAVADAIAAAFAARGFTAPAFFESTPAAGVARS